MSVLSFFSFSYSSKLCVTIGQLKINGCGLNAVRIFLKFVGNKINRALKMYA